MVGKASKSDKKIAYGSKLYQFLDEYSQVLLVSADNVGLNQLQVILRGLRGDSVILMGKNTIMKRSVRIHAQKTGNQGNVGLIFTKGDLKEGSEEVAKYKISAPAPVVL